jgi:hypothetical protein
MESCWLLPLVIQPTPYVSFCFVLFLNFSFSFGLFILIPELDISMLILENTDWYSPFTANPPFYSYASYASFTSA